MSDFKEFRALLQDHFNEMVKGENPLFITDADEDELYNLYLDSFPAGMNELFRKRREYDCSCCRRFVKNIGKLVAFDDGKMITVWNFDAKSAKYQPVVDALDAIFKTLNRQKKTANEDSLLAVKSAEDTELANKIELVKYIVSVKLAESEARASAAEKKAQRDKIMKIVAKKKDKELEDMGIDDLMKKLEELN